MKKTSLLLFCIIIMTASCTKTNMLSSSITSNRDSSSSGTEDVSYSAFADNINFYENKDGTCTADGAYVDPEIKEITIPDKSISGKTVTSISGFNDRKYLEKVTLPSSLKEIQQDTFSYDISLKNIVFPEILERISSCSFLKCSSLSEIRLPESLQTMDDSAFQYCVNLKTVRIPSHIKNIPDNAFDECTNLKDIYLPDGLESIGIAAFGYTSIDKIFIPKSVNKISINAFVNYPNRKTTLYVEAKSHPASWQLKSNNSNCRFIYGASRQDLDDA